MITTPVMALAIAGALTGAADTASARQPAPDSASQAATVVGAPLLPPRFPAAGGAPRAWSDTVPRRRAVEYGDGYARRLAVHRYASYAMVPLFVGQYVLGDRLLDQKRAVFAGRRNEPVDAGLRTAHGVTAAGVGVLFGVNTVTGLWNLYEARHDPNGRRRRTAHVLTMLVADAGFVATGVMGSRGSANTPREAAQHRNVALGSMAVAVAGASIMWMRDDR